MPSTVDQLSDKYIQLVIRKISISQLALALKGEGSELVERFLGNMSDNTQDVLNQVMFRMKNFTEMDVTDAQQKIIKILDVNYAEERMARVIQEQVETEKIVLLPPVETKMIDDAVKQALLMIKTDS
ncbi:MAG: hypothetical protein JKX97_07530 [Candidatus Lindowbacteria bacterium]|nr:hypothetical protein [Candidatus Lindowbacteria bacterium]